ncbi:MAG: S-ribosylhomocysteine lyase [Clostridiales bacterium]|jgi:S-ribosylhomocysteine lyase|nr:S-ribosylhomocysteine lyase [Clostridiales bacterium]
MEVASFTIDHDRLKRGVYVSRKDRVGEETVTTFDIRLKTPNAEPVLDNPAIHTLEHLFAVYLRGESGEWRDKVIYIGPMGCRTGFYLILKGDLDSAGILGLMKDLFVYTAEFSAAVPATTSKECGNYLDHNLAMAQWEARKFLDEVLTGIQPENLNYPA